MKVIQNIKKYLKSLFEPKTVLKKGDFVIYSEQNKHTSGVPSAYRGMSGIIDIIYRDGSFDLDCGSSILIISKGARRKPYTWLTVNGKLIKYKFGKNEYIKTTEKIW